MLTRLLGLAVVTTAAAVGVAAQVIAVPVAYAAHLQQRQFDRRWDWDTAAVPASVAHQEAA